VIPALFVAHGSPMVAIERSAYGDFLDNFGRTFPRPKAIVVFSAHWESPVQMVSEVEAYSTLYDFGGFPEALYRVKYPAKGDRELSRQIEGLLAAEGITYGVEKERGLDHGSWTILHRMYPAADIPVIAMSVDADLTPAEQFRLGNALSSLRADDILIVGSGVTVHNFQLFQAQDNPDVLAAVRAFDHWLEEKLHNWDTDALFDYEAQAPHAQLAVPPNGREHFVPLFYAMGAAGDSQHVRTLHHSWLMHIMTNTVYQFGELKA